MRIRCDTNIIRDVLLDRPAFAEKSCGVRALCEARKLEGFVSASAVTDIFYLVRKQTHSTELAYRAVGKLLEIVKVCGVTGDDVLAAFQKKARDFEDCLVAVCARSVKCDYIVTRNKADFAGFCVPAVTPEELLELV